MSEKFFVKEIHDSHSYITGYIDETPFTSKAQAVRVARDYRRAYRNEQPMGPAIDYHVVTGKGEIVWSHPGNVGYKTNCPSDGVDFPR